MTFAPDYLEVYRRRYKILNAVRDPPRRKSIITHYRANPVDFINDWGMTYDPRNSESQYIPMALFPRQVDFINFLHGCLKDKQSGLVEKSRDVGASWLCCQFAVWLLLLSPGSAVGFGSRVVDDVDKIGSPNSLFEKIRITLKYMPPFLLPETLITDSYMKMVNSDNGSTVIGGSGDNIGRGSRSTIFFVDESAHLEHPEMVEAALSANTDVKIDISSVNGNGNVFYRRRMAGELWTPEYTPPPGKTRVFIFDWRDNPMKNQAWYDERRAKAENEGLLHLFAQEVDRDYSASVDGIIIPAKWVRAAIDAHIQLGFKPSGEKVAALDVADEGGDKNALVHRHGVVMQGAEHWGEGDTGVTARRAVDACQNAHVNTLYYDAIGVGAGVKAETNRLKGIGQIPKSMKVYPWVASASPLDEEDYVIPNDDQSPLNGDFFANLRAQAWWRLRTRFEKTYRAVTQGIVYSPDELISIPSNLENIHQLEQELSQVIYKRNLAGKIVIDKKPAGTKSPNLADGVVMCYNPAVELNSFDVMY